MNQDQRKYLINQVQNTLSEQVKELEGKKPKKPSLNNFMIAAFLDGSIEFADLSPLRDKIKNRVVKMGKDDALIEEEDEDDWRYSNRRNKKSGHIKLMVEDVFIIPEQYKVALKEYQDKTDDIDNKIRELRAQAKTIEMKVQIGSAASLSKLITEVDNLADLSLFNSKFLLGGDEDVKKLKEK